MFTRRRRAIIPVSLILSLTISVASIQPHCAVCDSSNISLHWWRGIMGFREVSSKSPEPSIKSIKLTARTQYYYCSSKQTVRSRSVVSSRRKQISKTNKQTNKQTRHARLEISNPHRRNSTADTRWALQEYSHLYRTPYGE